MRESHLPDRVVARIAEHLIPQRELWTAETESLARLRESQRQRVHIAQARSGKCARRSGGTVCCAALEVFFAFAAEDSGRRSVVFLTAC